jgi:hypothetical protein
MGLVEIASLETAADLGKRDALGAGHSAGQANSQSGQPVSAGESGAGAGSAGAANEVPAHG